MTSHDAVEAVIAALAPRQLSPRVVITRDFTAAVVVAEDAVDRYTVIVERRNGEWVVPNLLGCDERTLDAERPNATKPEEPVVHVAVCKSGSPEEDGDGDPPSEAWAAVTGIAASDAVAIEVRTDLDLHRVDVDDDGFFVALVRSPWRGDVFIAAHTNDGRVERTNY